MQRLFVADLLQAKLCEMEIKRFYNDDPVLFKRTKELINEASHKEILLWGFLSASPLGRQVRKKHPSYCNKAGLDLNRLQATIEINGSIPFEKDVKQNEDKRKNFIRSFGSSPLRYFSRQAFGEFAKVVQIKGSFIKKYITKNIKGGTPAAPLGGLVV